MEIIFRRTDSEACDLVYKTQILFLKPDSLGLRLGNIRHIPTPIMVNPRPSRDIDVAIYTNLRH